MHCGRNAGLCQSAQWGLLLAPVVVVWQDGVFSKDAGRGAADPIPFHAFRRACRFYS